MPSTVFEKRCESGHIWSSRGALPRDLAGFLRRSPRWADHLGSSLIGPRAPLALATAPARPSETRSARPATRTPSPWSRTDRRAIGTHCRTVWAWSSLTRRAAGHFAPHRVGPRPAASRAPGPAGSGAALHRRRRRRRAVVRLRPGQRLRDRSTIGARRPLSRASVRWWQPSSDWWQPSSEVTGGGPTRRAGAGRHDSHAPAQGRRAHPPQCPPRRHRPQQSRPAAAPLRRGAGQLQRASPHRC